MHAPHSWIPISPPSASRRDFLRAAAATTTTLLTTGLRRAAAFIREPAVITATTSKVVRVFSERLIEGTSVPSRLLVKAIEAGLCELTGTVQGRDAWARLLKPDDVILVKFNQSGAREIGTTQVMAEAVTKSLIDAGWNPQRIHLLEHGSEGNLPHGLRRADTRWQGVPVEFGRSGRDTFMAAVDQATAIINIPYLKAHRLATMTGCLKNLSHGLIRHPARFHGGGCDPAIGEIVASEPVRSKLRLNLMNALRVVYDLSDDGNGPRIHAARTLLMSRDPVACDAVGFSILNTTRSLYRLRPLLSQAGIPASLMTAGRLGLGKFDLEMIHTPILEL